MRGHAVDLTRILGAALSAGAVHRLDDNCPKATDLQIATAERELGVRFPDLYKTFLADVGPAHFGDAGGFRPLEDIPGADSNGRLPLDLLYGISPNRNLDLVSNNTGLPGDIPKGYFAIGHDAGCNGLIMNRGGRVLYFDNASGVAYRVSESFEKFLASFWT